MVHLYISCAFRCYLRVAFGSRGLSRATMSVADCAEWLGATYTKYGAEKGLRAGTKALLSTVFGGDVWDMDDVPNMTFAKKMDETSVKELSKKIEAFLVQSANRAKEEPPNSVDLMRVREWVEGVFKKDETVVFLHTGGSAALFAYRDVFPSLKQDAAA